MTSVSNASEDDSISDEELGHMPTSLPDFKAWPGTSKTVGPAASDLMEARHSVNFLVLVLSLSKKYGSCLRGNPNQSTGCSAVGASDGVVDPKTHRKWQVGLGVYGCYHIAELIDVVVRLYLN